MFRNRVLFRKCVYNFNMRKYVLAGFIVLTRSLGHLVQKLRVAGVFLPPAFF